MIFKNLTLTLNNHQKSTGRKSIVQIKEIIPEKIVIKIIPKVIINLNKLLFLLKTQILQIINSICKRGFFLDKYNVHFNLI